MRVGMLDVGIDHGEVLTHGWDMHTDRGPTIHQLLVHELETPSPLNYVAHLVQQGSTPIHMMSISKRVKRSSSSSNFVLLMAVSLLLVGLVESFVVTNVVPPSSTTCTDMRDHYSMQRCRSSLTSSRAQEALPVHVDSLADSDGGAGRNGHTNTGTCNSNIDDLDLAPTNQDRRHYIAGMFIALPTTVGSLSSPQDAHAATAVASSSSKPIKSRSEGYEVRHTKAEWTSMLSGAQYNVLRRGGTERQLSSILEHEKRPGTYVCAGCQSPVFASAAKFSSGTGWPSFDSPIDGSSVEIENISAFQAAMDGAEVRCRTCGGHLGDVFGDGGWRYGTKTGKRYCINGAALVFRPEGERGREVRGDMPPPNKVIQYEPALRREPVA